MEAIYCLAMFEEGGMSFEEASRRTGAADIAALAAMAIAEAHLLQADPANGIAPIEEPLLPGADTSAPAA